MSNNFWLDWSAMTVSLINTILLIWLGLTVLLNAERRTWGAWVAGGGLILGGFFFFGHSTILGFGLDNPSDGLNFWWSVGWVPVVALPFVWYVIMLWYAGFWTDKKTSLYDRQKNWFAFTTLLAIILFGIFFLANPIPPLEDIGELNTIFSPNLFGLPIIILLYPLYIILNIALSMDALRRPGQTERVMGDLARQRARPWLIATSIALLFVSLLVAIVIIWILQNSGETHLLIKQAYIIAWFDLIIASLIGVAIVTLGQAIVAYEIFTGKALPRRGSLRQWRRAILLAVGYGSLVSWSLATNVRSIYSLLFTTLLMTFFYALLSWRSYTERERYIKNLRPFVRSQGLFDHLLAKPLTAPTEIDLQTPFDALCKDVLGTQRAYLVSVGSLAPLVGSPLTYPSNLPTEFNSIGRVVKLFDSPQPSWVAIDPDQNSGAVWAIPLWSARGLIGILLLGEKRDGGLYTQEEIEIAQTSGERLIDTKASAEISKRLMVLQRQRLAESQLIDQRTRRVLHDEVLQQLHAAMLKLVGEQSKPNGGTSEAIEMLAGVHNQISNLLRDMPTTTLPEISKLGLVGALRKVVDEEYGIAFEEVRWNVEPLAERETQDISSLTAEVLYYAAREAIRNAARHASQGRSNRPLHLVISVKQNPKDGGIQIQIEDDGSGIKGSPESNDSSSGQGLALHSTMMAVVGGELVLESLTGEFTRVSLSLPPG